MRVLDRRIVRLRVVIGRHRIVVRVRRRCDALAAIARGLKSRRLRHGRDGREEVTPLDAAKKGGSLG